jgi:hypothetical protein
MTIELFDGLVFAFARAILLIFQSEPGGGPTV